jgi:choline kinase
LLLETPETFGYEDITGLPWIEIDFPEDIQRAQNQTLLEIEIA